MEILVNYAGLEDADQSVKTVKSKFESEINELKTIVEETTEHDWIGPDATQFVNTANGKISKVHGEYDEFLTELSKEIMNNHDKFKDVQQHNLNTIE